MSAAATTGNPADSAAPAHTDVDVLQVAVACLEVQQLVDDLRAGTVTTDRAWLLFVEMAASFGWKSAPCRAFVRELAKRAA